MRKRHLFVAGVCLLSLPWLVALPQAHHAFAAEFDSKKVLTLEGTVVQMEWTNPHAWLTIKVEKDGKAEQWALELGPPNLLFRNGYRKNSLLPEMKVKVVGFGSRDGSNTLNVDTVTLSDGRVLKGESMASSAADEGAKPEADKPAGDSK